VTQVVSVPYFLLTGPQQPFQSVRDVITQARAKPGGMDYGTLGVGSAAHVRMAMLNRMAGTAMNHVPYKGSYMPDLMSGVLTVAFEPATTAIPLIKGGKLRALAVATSQRLPAFPDVATVAETLPGFNGDGWQAFVVPAGTPPEIAQRLNTETVRILQQPDIRARLAEFGLQAMGNSREEFARAMRSEYEKWGRIARENNIRVEG
jgi:tripartite-type tricarboxylate transporter receptor subunit TctC